MQPFGFCSATYQSAIPNADAQLAMNVYLEFIESGAGKSPAGLITRPRLRQYAVLPGESAVYGCMELNGRNFAAGQFLWELVNGVPVNRGELSPEPGAHVKPTQPITIVANQANQLLINSIGALWVFDLTTNMIHTVDMAQLRGPVSWIGFVDAQFIAQIAGTGFFQVSDLEDGAVWNEGGDIYEIESFPENITAMAVAFGEIWAQSNKKSVGYVDTGGTPQWQPGSGAHMEQGNGAQYSTVNMDNTYFWIGSREDGQGMAWKVNGYTPLRVSTHAVEFAWKKYPTIADAIGFTMQYNGHSFWVIYFPSADKTWFYDAATQSWHEEGFWDTTAGKYTAHRMRCHMMLGTKHIVGDWKTGTLYEMTEDALDDFGHPIRWIRRAPYIKGDKLYEFMPNGIEFELNSGSGPMPPLLDGAGNPVDPVVSLRWSDDNAHTWSNYHDLPIGQAGQYAKRVVYRRMGKFLGRKGRVVELSGSYPIRCVDAYV